MKRKREKTKVDYILLFLMEKLSACCSSWLTDIPQYV